MNTRYEVLLGELCYLCSKSFKIWRSDLKKKKKKDFRCTFNS